MRPHPAQNPPPASRAAAPAGPRLGVPTALAAALFLAGCANPVDARKDAAFQSYATTYDRPVVRPSRALSSFSDSLLCMDYMLREAQLPTTLIASKQIPDFSSRVPVATKDMVITALSQMSRLSNAFRVVDYEVDIARQDTVQNLTTILLNNNQMQLQRPALYISGAISYVEQNVISNRSDVGTSGSRLDTGLSQSRNATIIGLEMHLGDFRTRTLIPGLDSANEVVIGGAGQGLDLAGRIGSYGVTFNVGRDYTQGAGAATRTLVDLATIELIGKWARVPYWQCLTLDQTHPGFQRQMREWFDESGAQGQSALVQNALARQGYLPVQPAPLPANAAPLRAAVARFQADKGIAVTGVIDFATYERALRNFVGLTSQGTLDRIGWNASGMVAMPAGYKDEDGPPIVDIGDPTPPITPAVTTVELQIENPQPAGERPAFTEGEQVFLSATVSRASFLYCYFVDSGGTVMRLMPNAANPNAMVPANLAIRIPDWMSPNTAFIMDAGKPGTEAVACFAMDRNPAGRLAAALQGPALKAMPGFASLDAVGQALAQSLGGDSVVRGDLQWQVSAKRVDAAVPPPPSAPATR